MNIIVTILMKSDNYDDSHDHEHYSDGDNDLSENLGGSAGLPEHGGD